MTLASPYSTDARQRDQILRALALFAGLFGLGASWAGFLPRWTEERVPAATAMFVAVLVVPAAVLVLWSWLVPRWTGRHSFLSLLAGTAWLVAGSLQLTLLGALYACLGGLLLGAGLAGLVGRFGAPGPIGSKSVAAR